MWMGYRLSGEQDGNNLTLGSGCRGWKRNLLSVGLRV